MASSKSLRRNSNGNFAAALNWLPSTTFRAIAMCRCAPLSPVDPPHSTRLQQTTLIALGCFPLYAGGRRSSMASLQPPFRADHVGSLLRPPELKQARADHKNRKISFEELRRIEDKSIRSAIALQEAAGLQAVTDGEFRRAFWHVDFLAGFEGIAATQGQYALKFHGEGGAESETKSMMVVTGKVKRTKPIMVSHFEFL